MAGLVPAIHVFLLGAKTWMPGTSLDKPGMTPNFQIIPRQCSLSSPPTCF